MIFIQGQARDNRSDDPFVVDGVTASPDDPAVRSALSHSSEIRRVGSHWSGARTTVSRLDDWVSIEMWTDDADDSGRPAPLLATVPCCSLTDGDLAGTVDRLVAQCKLIERRVDGPLLLDDLEQWRLSPKAAGGLLEKLHRHIWKQLKRLRAQLDSFFAKLDR